MIIIGEKINASIPSIKSIIQGRDDKNLVALAEVQAASGVNYIDVNIATGEGTRDDEILSMRWAVETIQRKVDTPLSIDSADPAVLEEGLMARDGRPCLINSTKAEDSSLREIVPMTIEYDAPLVALALDEKGIPEDVKGRLAACEKIADVSLKLGLPMEKIYFDPLVLPIVTDIRQGLITLNTLSEIKKKIPGSRTVIGLSNVSYGLPSRSRLNAAFLHMAIYEDLDAVILDPLDTDLILAVKAAEALVGKDRHCRRYARALRKES
ncbi:MAG: dihydropteroate synthase [Deltaproteobacteria bacterium]|nr:dihydropteroate synthase [Deltaproteobacteria bacterium]MBW1920044.1 dihydropteroate synthase [Deltaproteobacteria bacterium]MBW1934935.1 dihydropteroate synthase [Deltaproteobacteria bacterium]MBW1977177.1 dihydropteroate synthase [Deltaproteobacteria bacterium]MBW2045603.1 dihydropteroate synthase [Deltaproteobacteria bacterium]